MIRQWLLFPLTNVNEINARQAHVALFVDNRNLQEKLREKLSSILDVERLVSRIAMDKAHPKDLQALKLSLIGWLNAREILCDYDFSLIDDELALNIIDLIDKSIQEDPAVIITDGGVIKEGWSSELDHWRQVRDDFDKILSEYEQEERQKTGITTLKIKYSHASGYFIEVSKGKLGAVPENFIMRRALVNGDRYTTARLQELEHELNQSGAKIVELERKLFVEIRTKLQEFISYLLQVSSEIAYTDATVSLAYAAITNAWTRPVVNDSFDFIVESGRHPVVELHIPSGEFVPNDLDISSNQEPQKSSFGLITGPNMAGKSTFLRQNALIALLAQTGSFVPAKNAVVGVVDRIFCRVGASDNLARGESTFLVEMTETANILRSATERSLVIMDEVGRGTSTEDGLSIAWAVSEYLLNHIKCRTLFATHYHELTRIEHDALSLLCMDVSEQNGSVVFLRKVKKGASENSYGIHVAKLAGIPQVVIDRANSILEHIQSIAENKPVLGNIPIVEQPKVVPQAPGLFSDEEIILDEILSAEPDNMTPLAALQAIARWKKALSGQ
jgi:DNA mismatch repair protein MutS